MLISFFCLLIAEREFRFPRYLKQKSWKLVKFKCGIVVTMISLKSLFLVACWIPAWYYHLLAVLSYIKLSNLRAYHIIDHISAYVMYKLFVQQKIKYSWTVFIIYYEKLMKITEKSLWTCHKLLHFLDIIKCTERNEDSIPSFENSSFRSNPREEIWW